VFTWLVPYYDPSFDDLENNNKKIMLYVSTTRDPFVWANYNGTLHILNLSVNIINIRIAITGLEYG
jgi:hypothetical protein